MSKLNARFVTSVPVILSENQLLNDKTSCNKNAKKHSGAILIEMNLMRIYRINSAISLVANNAGTMILHKG